MTSNDEQAPPTWSSDLAGHLTHTEASITEFHYHSTKLTLLRLHLLSARDGTLTGTWRDELTKTANPPGGSRPNDSLPDEHRQAHANAIQDLAATPPADWEPDQGVGWRQSLEAWFDAIKQCFTDIEHTEQQLRAQTGITIAAHIVNTSIDQDLATASYRAGLAAGGLDVDWYDWLIDRVGNWTDTRRRDYQLDLMTLEPNYRDTVQQLPTYWR
ncbi:hypothetical protein [Candidatus Mycobacterium methanotrophicum]|uniref:Uncharacterized protein n=1 Tax=Candidatus Mycobacterium methanotrophicum TaxID=2943498 RepID=A0ABY4QT03_9MYCO|nr:hypothetical protein [Candidatus Mycobacterium methanotrophicum]UQX13522.1 hypothetical protein M5I08_25345 [Candidatus Mycobacterium methanotrophicum]